MTDEALAINGFTREQIEDPSKMTEAHWLLHSWRGRPTNPEPHTGSTECLFDLEYVRAACHRASLDCPFREADHRYAHARLAVI